jgi:hypothetical protein
MAFVVGNLVLEQSNAPGVGDFVLQGQVAGRRTFAEAIGNLNETYYFAVQSDGQFERGETSVQVGATIRLLRETVRGNSNGTTEKSDFTGLVTVYVEIPAERIPYQRPDGTFSLLEGVFARKASAGALDGVTSINGGPLAGFRNAIINGGFRVNQQGTATGSALSLGDGDHFFDLWKSVGATTGIQVSSTGVVTLGAGEGIEQVVEAGAFEGGDTITVSVEDPAANLTVTLLDYSEADTASGTINSGSGRKGVTLTAPTLDSDGHVIVRIEDASGGATFKKVQAELGSVATPFERRHSQIENAFVQRYYVTGEFEHIHGGAHADITQSYYSWIGFPVSMRAVPSVSGVSNQGTFDAVTITKSGASLGRSDVVSNRVNSGTFTANARL